MKKIINTIKYTIYTVLLYFPVAIVCSYIPVGEKSYNCSDTTTIFLSTNGNHLDIILAATDIPQLFQQCLPIIKQADYLAIGWGEKDFYLNVQQWSDLTPQAAFRASFGMNDSLLHFIAYKTQQDDWVAIEVCDVRLEKLKKYIAKALYVDKSGHVNAYEGYGFRDVFYEANGKYSCFNTCNTWVNTGFKEVGMRSSLWTPFDFGLLHYYE